MKRRRNHRRFWTERAIATLSRDYANLATWKVARAVKRPIWQVYAKAFALGLKKSAAYMASPDACRWRRDSSGGIPYRFKPGHVPANKGLRRPGWAPGRMRETQFKRGMRNPLLAGTWPGLNRYGMPLLLSRRHRQASGDAM